MPDGNLLGSYLKDRRGKLDPAALGIPATRRRTPGLRREEVALRANVSATWYTWLEQGRGGAPSADVLNRISGALKLNEIEREHLFLLAQHRPPEAHYTPVEHVSPQLQRVLDSLETSPALVKTAAWDVMAWNAAWAAVIGDYGALPPEKRNILRVIFENETLRLNMPHWEAYARFCVAAFRTESVRAGASARATRLVEDLSRTSPIFAAIWRDYDVGIYGEGVKSFNHADVGQLTLEFATFTVDGQPDLGLIVFTPATAEDKSKVRRIVEAKANAKP